MYICSETPAVFLSCVGNVLAILVCKVLLCDLLIISIP